MLAEQSIAFSKYIKPPHLRTENQRVAHVTIGFNHREDANFAIRNGMFIEGKHVNTRKMLTEPRRCLKCQKYGHYVANCKEKEDTCARCAERHRTSACTITDTTNSHAPTARARQQKDTAPRTGNARNSKQKKRNTRAVHQRTSTSITRHPTQIHGDY